MPEKVSHGGPIRVCNSQSSFSGTNKVPLKCERMWVLLGLIKYNLIEKIWLVMTSFSLFQKIMTMKFYCMES